MSRTTSHGQRGIAMDNSGATVISDDAAGHDLAIDGGLVTGNAHAAVGRRFFGAQHGARVGTIGQTAADDGGAEIDAALPVGQAAFRRIKGAAGDGHGSIAVVEDIGDACAAVVVSHAAAHHGGMEGAAIDGDAGAIRGGCTVRPSTGLDIVASHDQLVGIGFACSTEGAAIDGHGSGAGLESSAVIIGKLAAAHHELGGSGFIADSGGDGAMRSLFVVGIGTAYIAAADDLADASALDGEGDVGGNGRNGGEFIIFVQPAAHEVIDLVGLVITTASPQRHVIRGHSHTGAAHDQHAGHSQAAESVHQVALFEHRLVPVDEVPDGSLGKLHNSISRICDVRPTTGVRCTGRLSGRETKNRCK